MEVQPVLTSETFSNDCFIKALNFLVQYHYFTHQEQVMRFCQSSLGRTRD